MSKPRHVRLSLAILVCMTLAVCRAEAQPATEPGGSAADTASAIQNPDEYAWKLFLYLNRQALAGKAGVPDPSKPDLRSFDPDKDVVWETWALATGGLPQFLAPGERNRSEVYLDKGAKPVAWEDLPRGTATAKVFDANLTAFTRSVRSRLSANTGDPRLLIEPAVFFPKEFEVRMNKSTFDTIRNLDFYSVEGLENKFREATTSKNRDIFKFEPMSKEVKAKWVKITEADKPRYHWRTLQRRNPDGTPVAEIWGLAGMHILTKDLPNWFWSDFEHVDWEQKQPDGSPDPRKSVDSTTRDDPLHGTTATAGKDGVRNETTGSVWENYRLRGTQVDFVDKKGVPTEVANTLIEPFNDGPSSCMTCHAKASVGLRPDPTRKRPPPFAANSLSPDFVNGIPDPTALGDNGTTMTFVQTDFLWSMVFRAHSQNEQ
jgi:hypothetical protein